MNLAEILKNLPKFIQILQLLKEADIDKDGKTSVVEWFVVLLKAVKLFVSLSPEEVVVLEAFIKYLQENQKVINNLILALKEKI